LAAAADQQKTQAGKKIHGTVMALEQEKKLAIADLDGEAKLHWRARGRNQRRKPSQ
jgi:hypothetical protein